MLTRVSSSYIMRSLDDKTIKGDDMISAFTIISLAYTAVLAVLVVKETRDFIKIIKIGRG